MIEKEREKRNVKGEGKEDRGAGITVNGVDEGGWKEVEGCGVRRGGGYGIGTG